MHKANKYNTPTHLCCILRSTMPKIPLTKHEKSSIYAQKYPSEFRVLPNGELISKFWASKIQKNQF